MKRRFRIVSRRDFDRLLQDRRLFAGRALVAFAAPGNAETARVGVTASRRVGGAVARNRARRRLREAARLRLLAADSPTAVRGKIDIVLIARAPVLRVPFAALADEVAEVGRRIQEAAR